MNGSFVQRWIQGAKLTIKQFRERNLPIDPNRHGYCNPHCINCCHNLIRCPFWRKWKDENGVWHSNV